METTTTTANLKTTTAKCGESSQKSVSEQFAIYRNGYTEPTDIEDLEVQNEGFYDLSLQYSDDRVKKVLGVLGDKDSTEHPLDSWLLDYIDSHSGDQVKKKTDIRSEESLLSQQLEKIADYLLAPQFMNEEHENLWQEDTTGTVLDNVKRNNIKYVKGKAAKLNEIEDGYPDLTQGQIKKNKVREVFITDLYNNEYKKYLKENEGKEDEFNPNSFIKRAVIEWQSEKEYRDKTKVTDSDYEKFPELAEMKSYLDSLGRMLGYHLPKNYELSSKECQQKIIEQFDENWKHKIELQNEENEKQPIYHKREVKQFGEDPTQEDIHYPVFDGAIFPPQETLMKTKLKQIELERSRLIAENRNMTDEQMNKVLDEYEIKIALLNTLPAALYNTNTNRARPFEHKPGQPIHRVSLGRYERKEYTQDNLAIHTGQQWLWFLKNMYKEVSKELFKVREELIKYATRSKGCSHESTDYNLLGQVEYGNFEHIKAIFSLSNDGKTVFSYLWSEHDKNIGSELWTVVTDIDELIEKSELNEIQRCVIELLKYNNRISAIPEGVKLRLNVSVTEDGIRKMLNETIPKKAHRTYIMENDWIEFRSELKQCSTCKIEKPPTDRFYGKSEKRCKQCENERKRKK